MNRQTAQHLRRALAAVAVAAAALLPTLAEAAPATATSNVNVRATPGGAIVGVLASGQRVDRQQCQDTWCYVVGSNIAGWVSSSYLAGGGGGNQVIGPVNPSPNFGISVGPGGVSIGVGQPPRPTPPPPPRPGPGPGPFPPGPGPGPFPPGPGPGPRPPRPPVVEQACFYERAGMRGASFCAEAGDRIANLGRWDSRIGSIENGDGLQVRVCTRPNFRGDCRVYTTDAFNLGRFDGSISSIQVY